MVARRREDSLVSDHDPLDLVQADLVARPIVELGRPRGLVAGNALSMLR